MAAQYWGLIKHHISESRLAPIAIRWRGVLRCLRAAVHQYPLADSADSLSCQPLFIIGSPRSGTKLLRSMLVAGGEVAIPPESQVIGNVVRKYLSLQHLGWADIARLTIALFESSSKFRLWKIDLSPVYRSVIELGPGERSLARVIDEVFRCYAERHFPEAGTWGDASPLNTLHLSWIFRTYPGARYLHLLRDGRDAISSMVAKGRTLEYATQRWLASVGRALELEDQLDSRQFLRIRYEDLVSSPSESLGQICTFLGVGYRDRMLDYWQLPTTVEHRYYDYHSNLRRPVFTDSIGKWIERLSADQQQYVLSRTSDLLVRLDYMAR